MPNTFIVGEFHADPSLNAVSGPAGSVRLEPKVMQVLVCLAEHAPRVVLKEQLIRAVWPDAFVSDDVLTRAVSELRRVLGDEARNPRFIETIPKSGYRLIAPVRFTPPGNDPATPAVLAGNPATPAADIVATGGLASVRAPRTRLRSRRAVLAAFAIVAAVVLVVLIVRQVTAPPSVRVVRSVQLTVDTQVASPGLGEAAFFPGLAADASRIYFTRMGDSYPAVAQTPAGGGDIVTIPTPFDYPVLLNLSPDGSRLLVGEFADARQHGPLWAIPVVGGAPVRLGSIVAQDAAWSPDGKQLVFARGNELYVAGADGRNPRMLTSTPGPAYWLRWSPDCTRLRFSIFNPEASGPMIWETSAEGQTPRPLALGRAEHDMDCCGEWTPGGRYFLFRRFRGGRADIWVARERTGWFARRTGQPVPLTSGPLLYSAALAPHDGRLLAVAAKLRGETLRFDAATRGLRPYTLAGSGGWFAFSRDSEWVAYVQYRLTELTLWRSRVDGTERRQLTQAPMRVLLPRWSPDGSRLVFMGYMPGQPWRIHTIAAAGGEPQLVLPDDRPASDPDWSPDGRSLIFGRPPDYLAEPSEPKAIHLFDLESGDVSTLPGSEGLFAPRWSPGGQYVAALTLDHTTLRLFDWSTRRWTELGRFKRVHNPAWSRDGRYLYVEDVHDPAVHRIRISDRAVETVAALEPPSKGAFCIFEGLTPDDAPLVSCQSHDSDIYALDWEAR